LSGDEPQRKALLAAVMGGLAAWGGLLSVGAYLGLDAQTPSYDIRRLLVVAGVTAGILAFWGAALLARARRLRRKKEERERRGANDRPQTPPQS
jgi:membrane protein DedA with SNARE-associated domain